VTQRHSRTYGTSDPNHYSERWLDLLLLGVNAPTLHIPASRNMPFRRLTGRPCLAVSELTIRKYRTVPVAICFKGGSQRLSPSHIGRSRWCRLEPPLKQPALLEVFGFVLCLRKSGIASKTFRSGSSFLGWAWFYCSTEPSTKRKA